MAQQRDARRNGGHFPDPGIFAKWEWDDDDTSRTGPYQSELNWWACSTLSWIREQLMEDTFPRGDYREMCELINIILGGDVSSKFFSEHQSAYFWSKSN